MKTRVGALLQLGLGILAIAGILSSAVAFASSSVNSPAREASNGLSDSLDTIRGTVFEDIDGNGQRDRGEPGIAGVTVSLSDNEGQPLGSQQTAADGSFVFTDLEPGTYCLTETDPPGYESTTPNTLCVPSSITEVLFGDRRLPTQTPTPGPSPTSAPPTHTPTFTGTSGPSPTPTETPTSWIDPSQAQPVYCHGTFMGDTTGKPNNCSFYGTLDWPETGGEDVYILTKTVASETTIRLYSLSSADLDVFLLYNPHPAALIAAEDWKIEQVLLAPGTYYIVVDGYNGAAGPYRLTVDCEGEPTPTPSPTPTPTPTLSPTATNTPDFRYYPLIMRQPTPTRSPTPTPPPYEKAVNCGSSESYQASDGALYAPDQPYTVGSWGWSGCGASCVTTITGDILDTEDDPIYRSQRYAMNAYYFTVPPGRYEVMLRFAEILRYTRPGYRVFAVEIEGQRVLDQFDILAVKPMYHAVDRTFTVNVVDGLLSVVFVPQSDDYGPAVNGIRVRVVGAAE